MPPVILKVTEAKDTTAHSYPPKQEGVPRKINTGDADSIDHIRQASITFPRTAQAPNHMRRNNHQHQLTRHTSDVCSHHVGSTCRRQPHERLHVATSKDDMEYEGHLCLCDDC
jgi:hypothetical protein